MAGFILRCWSIFVIGWGGRKRGGEGLAEEVGGAERPEFWERFWALYVQSEISWRLSKTERNNRYRQCGQDIKEILEWIDTKDPKLSELEAGKLLRRGGCEQFVGGGGGTRATHT